MKIKVFCLAIILFMPFPSIFAKVGDWEFLPSVKTGYVPPSAVDVKARAFLTNEIDFDAEYKEMIGGQLVIPLNMGFFQKINIDKSEDSSPFFLCDSPKIYVSYKMGDKFLNHRFSLGYSFPIKASNYIKKHYAPEEAHKFYLRYDFVMIKDPISFQVGFEGRTGLPYTKEIVTSVDPLTGDENKENKSVILPFGFKIPLNIIFAVNSMVSFALQTEFDFELPPLKDKKFDSGAVCSSSFVASPRIIFVFERHYLSARISKDIINIGSVPQIEFSWAMSI